MDDVDLCTERPMQQACKTIKHFCCFLMYAYYTSTAEKHYPSATFVTACSLPVAAGDGLTFVVTKRCCVQYNILKCHLPENK